VAVTETSSLRPTAPAPRIAKPSASAWRAFAVCLALASVGLLLVSIANAVSRSGGSHGDALMWAGAGLIVLPAALRLTGETTSRQERIALVVLVGLDLYLMKFFNDPTRFMYADELVHAYNADTILRTGGLFHPNPILPVTPDYPGLEAVTSGVASVGHISMFAAGMVVVGAGRLVMMLALFRIMELLTQSAKYAGLAGLLYVTSPNFLFFTAQFSYESMALPLMVAALFAVVSWMRADDPGTRRAWTVAGAILISGVVVTHHMTAYVLIVALLAMTGVARLRRERSPYHLAAFAVAATAAWLVVAGSQAVGYLTPVFFNALKSTFSTIMAETAPRAVLVSKKSGVAQPVLYRFVAAGNAALVVIGLVVGLRLYWRTRPHPSVTILLALASLAYVAALGTRLVPRAWEISNRSSEFLFIGVCFILAGTAIHLLRWDAPSTARRLAVTGIIGFIFAGGVVIGHPTTLLLAQPLEVRRSGAAIPSPSLAAAEWVSHKLGPRRRIAADRSGGRLLLQFDEHVFLGHRPDIHDILATSTLAPWQMRQLQGAAIRYVFMDRRAIGNDQSAGYYFCGVQAVPCTRVPVSVWRKFNRELAASRIFDDGNIVVYDIRRVIHPS
jgi:hypothetical protein